MLNNKRFNFGVAISLCIVVSCCIALLMPLWKSSFSDLASSKLRQYRYGFLRDNSEILRTAKTIYYYTPDGSYNDYRSSVMRLFIEYMDREALPNFTLLSKSGCYIWHAGNEQDNVQCRRSRFNPAEQYDVILVEDQPIDSDKMLEEGYVILKMTIPPMFERLWHSETYILYRKK